MHLHAYARNMMSAYRPIRAMAIAYNGYCLCIRAVLSDLVFLDIYRYNNGLRLVHSNIAMPRGYRLYMAAFIKSVGAIQPIQLWCYRPI